MIQDYSFKDIRSFHDSEVDKYLQLLFQEDGFHNIMQFIFKDQVKIEQAKLLLKNTHSIKDLQSNFMGPIAKELILDRSTDGQTFSGLENIDKNESYLYISNHRDILLDSALMNYLILQEGMNTTEMAIGDNLLVKKWIEYVMKLNRAFIVRRNLPVREMLLASKKLSAYIRSKIIHHNTSVWIAQGEGRTKNGDDKTQPALLKMLNLSNTNDFTKGFKELKIVPVSISYEIEPCGISKVAEILKKQNGGYEKTKEDDLRSMEEGLIRPKGRIHFGFGKPMSSTIELFKNEVSRSAQFKELANHIDQQIYSNFKLWPNNYIAEDILNNSNSNSGFYTNDQYLQFTSILDEAINLIPGDSQTSRNMFLQMYVNPLVNKRDIQ